MSESAEEPAAEGVPAGPFPQAPVEAGHHAPAPRRIRGLVGSTWVLDTLGAFYVWEHPYYPQYVVPRADLLDGVLVSDDVVREDVFGTVARHSLRVGDDLRRGVALVRTASPTPELVDTVRFTWPAFDHWFEEDEEIFVHPRNPYARVDAVRSSRHVRVELDGVLIAESDRPVALFETGLPPRWYLDRADVRWEHLVASPTVTSCPYKGTTSRYWSARVGDRTVDDIAWCYDFPTVPVSPIAGLVAFYDEKLTVTVG